MSQAREGYQWCSFEVDLCLIIALFYLVVVVSAGGPHGRPLTVETPPPALVQTLVEIFNLHFLLSLNFMIRVRRN